MSQSFESRYTCHILPTKFHFQPDMSNLFNHMDAKGLFCFKDFFGGNLFQIFSLFFKSNVYLFFLLEEESASRQSRQIGRLGGVGKSAESINRQVGKLAEERVNEIQKTKWTESASAESAEAGTRDYVIN